MADSVNRTGGTAERWWLTALGAVGWGFVTLQGGVLRDVLLCVRSCGYPSYHRPDDPASWAAHLALLVSIYGPLPVVVVSVWRSAALRTPWWWILPMGLAGWVTDQAMERPAGGPLGALGLLVAVPAAWGGVGVVVSRLFWAVVRRVSPRASAVWCLRAGLALAACGFVISMIPMWPRCIYKSHGGTVILAAPLLGDALACYGMIWVGLQLLPRRMVRRRGERTGDAPTKARSTVEE